MIIIIIIKILYINCLGGYYPSNAPVPRPRDWARHMLLSEQEEEKSLNIIIKIIFLGYMIVLSH